MGAYCSTGLEGLPFQKGTGPWKSVTDLPMRSRRRQPAGKRVALATLLISGQHIPSSTVKCNG